ncbi:MAG: ArsR/SmtB family transcription factor [Halodesulfurarchaeum sp.]
MSSPIAQIRPGETTASTEPRVISLEGSDVDAVFEALSSETRRGILGSLYDDPATPSELAKQTETSLQNVHYHLEKLSEVDLVESVGTRYSEKGAEMSVFAPTSDPLVVVEGETEREEIESRLRRIVGAISTIIVGSVLVQFLLGSRVSPGADDGMGITTAETESVESAGSAGTEILDTLANTLVEPGAMLLVGGLLSLLLLEAMSWRKLA